MMNDGGYWTASQDGGLKSEYFHFVSSPHVAASLPARENPSLQPRLHLVLTELPFLEHEAGDTCPLSGTGRLGHVAGAHVPCPPVHVESAWHSFLIPVPARGLYPFLHRSLQRDPIVYPVG